MNTINETTTPAEPLRPATPAAQPIPPTNSSFRLSAPEPVVLKVAVSATAQQVTLSFNPVSVDEVRQTRELNRSVQLGFVPPVASTR